MLEELIIEQVTAAVTWRLRQQVLYPSGTLKDVMVEGDFEASHFGAYHRNMLIGVISLFGDDESLQFRKFAVRSDYQRQGVGRELLLQVFSFAKEWHVHSVWCHARLTAVAFYERMGMQRQGNSFQRNGLDYVRMERKLK